MHTNFLLAILRMGIAFRLLVYDICCVNMCILCVSMCMLCLCVLCVCVCVVYCMLCVCVCVLLQEFLSIDSVLAAAMGATTKGEPMEVTGEADATENTETKKGRKKKKSKEAKLLLTGKLC